MSHAWTHSWCKSPCRDEAVRASEDGRPGPLPTLEECIERVTNRRPVDAGGGGNVTGLRVAYGQAVVARLTDERDAAIRERDEFRRSFRMSEEEGTRLVAERDAALDDADALRARVAELESQLESVACRAATPETALRQIVAQDYSRAAVNGASWKMHDIAEKALQSAPAASVNGGLNPHAWGVLLELHQAARDGGDRLEKALAAAERLLTQPRPASLADRVALLHKLEQCGIPIPAAPAASGAAGTGVVLPECPFTPESTHTMGWLEAIGKVKKALAAAGVKVKEVG